MAVVIFSASAASVTQYSHEVVDFTVCGRNPELKYVPQIYDHGENMNSVVNKVSQQDKALGFSIGLSYILNCIACLI